MNPEVEQEDPDNSKNARNGVLLYPPSTHLKRVGPKVLA